MKSYIHLLLLPSVALTAPTPLRRKLSTLLKQDDQLTTTGTSSSSSTSYGPSKTQMLRQMIGIDVLVKDLSSRNHDEHDFVRIEWVETLLEKAARDVRDYNGNDKVSLQDSITDLKNEIGDYKSEASLLLQSGGKFNFEVEEEKVKEMVDSPDAALTFEEKYDFKSLFDKVGAMKLYITDLSNEIMMLAVDVQKDARAKKEQLRQAASRRRERNRDETTVPETPSFESLLTDLTKTIAEKKEADLPPPTAPPHFLERQDDAERASHRDDEPREMTQGLIQSLKEFGVSDSEIAAHFGVDESEVQIVVAAAAAAFEESSEGDVGFAPSRDEMKDWRFGLDEHEIAAKVKQQMLERGEMLDP